MSLTLKPKQPFVIYTEDLQRGKGAWRFEGIATVKPWQDKQDVFIMECKGHGRAQPWRMLIRKAEDYEAQIL